MNREYLKGYSRELNREMEMLVFGHAGMPLLVFPTSMGRFFEYEDRGMIAKLAQKIERGEMQVYCPDAVDLESWYNKGVHPRVRVLRHLQYERYILHELLPFLRWKNSAPRLAATSRWTSSSCGYSKKRSRKYFPRMKGVPRPRNSCASDCRDWDTSNKEFLDHQR